MIRKAYSNEVVRIQHLINSFAASGAVLPRSLNNIYEYLRDFFVYEEKGTIYGCCALHIVWEDLAEIRSLVVDVSRQGKGIGRKLVQACIHEASDLRIKKIFLLTEKEKFFGKFGFMQIDKASLPHKVWSDCIDCIKFPNCSEVAMSKDM